MAYNNAGFKIGWLGGRGLWAFTKHCGLYLHPGAISEHLLKSRLGLKATKTASPSRHANRFRKISSSGWAQASQKHATASSSMA